MMVIAAACSARVERASEFPIFLLRKSCNDRHGVFLSSLSETAPCGLDSGRPMPWPATLNTPRARNFASRGIAPQGKIPVERRWARRQVRVIEDAMVKAALSDR